MLDTIITQIQNYLPLESSAFIPGFLLGITLCFILSSKYYIIKTIKQYCHLVGMNLTLPGHGGEVTLYIRGKKISRIACPMYDISTHKCRSTSKRCHLYINGKI